jgi:hypothetical protein
MKIESVDGKCSEHGQVVQHIHLCSVTALSPELMEAATGVCANSFLLQDHRDHTL